MKTNTSKLRLTQSTHEVKNPIKNGQQVLIQARAIVIGETYSDNQDGTQNLTSKAKIDFIDIKEISGDSGEVVQEQKNMVKGKSPSQSVKHRAWAIAQELGESESALYGDAINASHEYLDIYRDKKLGYE